MNSTIQLTFLYAERDYVRAMRAHFASRLRIKLDLAVAAAAALSGIYLWQSPDLRWWGVGLLCTSATLLLMLFAAFFLIPRLVFRREPKFRDEYSLSFSPEGIHFRTAHIDSQLQWSMYNRVLIDAYSIVLYHGVQSFTVIPKRVFESPEQLAALERLISESIPTISKSNS